ncbi:malonyl-CoA-acyl carrier protein transacylase, mitochondrial [Lingula anatina]|uniref:Malonyl-CoA-acyl carrier protein transacylase, mitochondrial n=1 Tax=Lingula anatina TaxID=7574 RepID=A0A1S3K851_LINAN|nr:malonyl-CoA-acyl carrier protein transacylase, mitochondrial [Lingula anatina]|eukprot:XP_013418436.1 malonyl-CoA-acyl carrier protein transacylase, mitochondrial [Lingula anatina]
MTMRFLVRLLHQRFHSILPQHGRVRNRGGSFMSPCHFTNEKRTILTSPVTLYPRGRHRPPSGSLAKRSGTRQDRRAISDDENNNQRKAPESYKGFRSEEGLKEGWGLRQSSPFNNYNVRRSRDAGAAERGMERYSRESREKSSGELNTLQKSKRIRPRPTEKSMKAEINMLDMDEKEFFHSDSESSDDEDEVEGTPLFDAAKAKLLKETSFIHVAEEQRSKQDQTAHAYRPNIDPRETSIILFPGQGSQFVGMGKKLLGYSNVKDMFEMANEILGYDLLELCLHGPISELNKTVHCQPAVFVTSLAAVEMMKDSNPKVLEKCITTTGFSVGEYAALVFAGAMTFEDGLKLVKTRAQLMQRASEEVPGGLMTVFLWPNTELGEAKQVAMEFCRQKAGIVNPVCSTANYLCFNAKVLGGNIEALKFIEKSKSVFNIPRVKPLPVSGAFHTALMRPIAQEFKKKLDGVKIGVPLIPVQSNVNAKRYRKPDVIKKMLVKQLYSPVKWEQIMQTLYARPKDSAYPDTYELGPGKQLGTLLKSVCQSAHKNYMDTDV